VVPNCKKVAVLLLALLLVAPILAAERTILLSERKWQGGAMGE